MVAEAKTQLRLRETVKKDFCFASWKFLQPSATWVEKAGLGPDCFLGICQVGGSGETPPVFLAEVPVLLLASRVPRKDKMLSAPGIDGLS